MRAKRYTKPNDLSVLSSHSSLVLYPRGRVHLLGMPARHQGSMMPENWLPITGFEGQYEVSDLGRVRSLSRAVVATTGIRHRQGRIRKFGLASGYHVIQLGVRGARHTYIVHRLVAQAFIPNPENKPEVNHLHAPKTNNCADNLEWATRPENTEHAVANDLIAYGEAKPNHCLTESEVIELRSLAAQGWSYVALAQRYMIHPVTASDAARRKTWKRVL